MTMTTAKSFRRTIWQHYRKYKRAMPWRETRDPYRILVSEIMLQQTQVARVMKFYPEFLAKFPNFRSLARARRADVLRAWQGLGYNRRALALQRLSRIVLRKFNGKLPRRREDLESLPGIGKATAGAIRAFAWDEPEIFIETNIRRVFIRFFLPRRARVTDAELARYIGRTLPRKNVREWYWGLMDYGAMLLADRRRAGENPNHRSAHFKKQPRFAGSDRELRGKILKHFLASRPRRRGTLRNLAMEMGEPVARIRNIVAVLLKEGFFKKK